MAEARTLSEALHALAVGANSAERLMPRRDLRRHVIRMSLRLCEVLDPLQPPENGPVPFASDPFAER